MVVDAGSGTVQFFWGVCTWPVLARGGCRMVRFGAE